MTATTVAVETKTLERELVLTALIDAPREKLFRAWTEPALIKQWFAPLPWTTPHAEMDVRAGGATNMVMRGPNGEEFPNPGLILEVVKNEKLVFTDAYTKAWEPSAKPFMTVVLTFADEGGKTPLHRPRAALDQGRLEGARGDGFPPGLDPVHPAARRAGGEDLTSSATLEIPESGSLPPQAGRFQINLSAVMPGLVPGIHGSPGQAVGEG